MKEGKTISDWYGVTMAEYAGRMLFSYVDRPVVDQTGLTGRYDLHLEFVREPMGSGPVLLNGVPMPAPEASGSNTAGPSIFSALQEQLGLKLSPARSPLDVIMVDHAEKASAN